MTRKKIPPPDLRVIDKALEFLPRVGLSCWALRDACRTLGISDTVYLEQYEQSARVHGMRPEWWGNWPPTCLDFGARRKALKKFKQMCIDAAKKTQP